MIKWKAITESGTTYERDGGFVRITSANGYSYTIKIWAMQVSLYATTDEKELGLPWIEPESWADSDFPAVGQHLYVMGKDDWRISTPIKEYSSV